MRFFLSVLVVLSVMLSSCTSDQEQRAGHTSIKNSYGIELNDGKKWVVVEEMMKHIRNMEIEIDRVANTQEANYSDSGKSLEDHIGLLTSNCTMTGKAHDELHKWLLPFIDLVEDLNAADSKELQLKSFEAIQESMNEFNTYFK